jgi:uncharacterized protein (UPF0332 family)
MTEFRQEAVHYWWKMAEESLASARREYEFGAYSFAINRLYYTIFYAASAALLERQLTFVKHSGVRAAFHREFIKTELLDKEWGKFYDELFEDRQEGDYLAFSSFERSYVEAQLKRGAQFLNLLGGLMTVLPHG